MKRFSLLSLLLAGALTMAAPFARAQGGSNCVDVYADLGCVRWYYIAAPPGSSGGDSVADAQGNSDKINNWFDANSSEYGELWDGLKTKNTLVIPYGFIALAEPIGVKTTQTVTSWSNSSGDLVANFTYTAGLPNGFPNYLRVKFAQTSGTLPQFLANNGWYFVVNVGSGQYKLAATLNQARAGDFIDYGSNTPSGTSTMTYRSLPSNFSLICGGGWSNTTYLVGYIFNNLAGGIVWKPGTAAVDDVPIRLARHGNTVRLNIMTNPWVGNDTPTRPYARAAIQMFDEGRNSGETGRHEISLNAAGFQSAIRIDNCGNGYADETYFPYLFTRDCYSMVTNESNNQSIGHTVNFACYYCPRGDNGTVFNLQDGGIWNVSHLSVVGDDGATVCQMNSQNGSNLGEFQIEHLHVDKALSNATKSTPTTQSVTVSNSSGKLLLTGNTDWANGTRVCFSSTAPGGTTVKQLYYVTGKSFSAGTWTAYLANTHELAHRNQSIDRVAWVSGSGSYTLANTKGYFRLFDSYRPVCSKIRMKGMITFANENLREAGGWMNYFDEPLVNYSTALTFAGIPYSEFRDVALDLVGLDDPTEIKYGTRKKVIQIPVIPPITNVGVADAQAFFVVPEAYDGYRIAKVQADVAKAGSGTGDTTVQIAKASGGGAYVDLLSTPIVVAQGTVTYGNTPVIQRDSETYGDANNLANNARERVKANDRLRIDVDTVNSGTVPMGLNVTLWLVP